MLLGSFDFGHTAEIALAVRQVACPACFPASHNQFSFVSYSITALDGLSYLVGCSGDSRYELAFREPESLALSNVLHLVLLVAFFPVKVMPCFFKSLP